MNIKETAKEIHQIARDKGFYDKERNFGEMLMLVVSELSEALEAHRNGKPLGNDCYNFLDEYDDTLIEEEESGFHDDYLQYVKGCVAEEIADAVIRLFDIAEYLNMDIEWHIRAKIGFNKTRPKLHGKKY